MIYDLGQGGDKNWILAETEFKTKYLSKYEVAMALGNGYLGIRSATEEPYLNETRNTFVAGTFNRFDDGEVTELPNTADVTGMKFEFNGTPFDLAQGEVKSYCRTLNVRTGELQRKIIWSHKLTGDIQLDFYRFVSMDNLHVIGQRVEITPLEKKLKIKIESGIDGQMTNSGVSHFSDGKKRFFDQQYMQLVQTTTESNIKFVVNSCHDFHGENEKYTSQIRIDRRQIFQELYRNADVLEKVVIDKISTIHSSRDNSVDTESVDLESFSLEELKKMVTTGFDKLFEDSVKVWQKKVWDKSSITIQSEDDFDQLVIRLAQYHLFVMTPSHDNRMSVAAKGLSGEGYKGHVFWDTEIFILPYFTFSHPEIARKLLEYRYLSLDGAHEKAALNGYKGAMFPWESAWLEDGEVTPVWGAADIVTGEQTKILSGFIEHHITADIAYAVWQYFEITQDHDFMDRYGYEIIFDTAIFWSSRLEWSEEKKEYHINDVIGADEYKEHVNNNAYTNYMAHFNILLAIKYYDKLKIKNEEIYDELNKKMDLGKYIGLWGDIKKSTYLPQENEDGLIPQDDTFLSKEIIDLTQYKQSETIGALFDDYNLEQVNQMQVTKQADVMALFFLLEDRFSVETKRKNWDYYEEKTTHDSSLSLAIHSVLASDMEDEKLAYQMFSKAARIDFGRNMKSCDAGIHAASVGGIWLSVVNGFGGVRMLDGKLRIEPHLPPQWDKLVFPVIWHGDRLIVEASRDYFTVINETKINKNIEFISNDGIYLLDDKIVVQL